MLGSLVIFLLASVIVGYIMKSGQERDTRERRLGKVRERLEKKEAEWTAEVSENKNQPNSNPNS